ncbi:MAG: hypothetical protein M3N12_08520 [Verrucomicrobiota bacterium]|nr:hypothetical protein [Verrucomicrobiota bacterium]
MTHSRRRRPRRTYPELQAKHGDFIHVAGNPIGFATEIDRIVSNIDHVWITLRVGEGESLRIALSTHSRQNAAAGFDARVGVGMIESSWTELPVTGLQTCAGLDYRAIEAATPTAYTAYERPALETMLMETTDRAIFIEAWGELYVRDHLGLHQVHSRRASCSVLKDYLGRDGAIRFYFPDATATMLLFKFCGQS